MYLIKAKNIFPTIFPTNELNILVNTGKSRKFITHSYHLVFIGRNKGKDKKVNQGKGYFFGLSRRKHGFDPRWDHQLNQVDTKLQFNILPRTQDLRRSNL